MTTLGKLIDVMSPSRLDCAQRCLAQFRFRYLDRLPSPKPATTVLGSAMDAAANDVYLSKMDTGTTLSGDDVADRFVHEFDWHATQVEDWTVDRGKTMDTGVRVATTWRDNIAQHVTPSQVQPQFKRDVVDPVSGDQFTFTGYVDTMIRVGDQEAVADLKTTGRRYPTNQIVKATQPAVYTLLTGQPTFVYHVVTTTAKPSTQCLTGTLSDSHHRHTLIRTGMVRRQVAAAYSSGDWLPNRGHMLCSRRWCPYWRQCEVEYGGEVAQ